MKNIFVSFFLLASLVAFGQSSVVDDLWKLYQSKDYDQVIDKAVPLLEADPLNVNLNLLIGRTYTDQGNFKEAVPYLTCVVKNDSNNSWLKAWALGYLGTCYFMLQKYQDSKQSLTECIHLNATKNATNDAYGKTLLFGFHEFYDHWKIVETENFRFYFQNMSDGDIEKYTSLRENAYKSINGFFKSTLPKKTDFFVWESREDAVRILKANLGFARPGFCIVHSHYQQTVGHEMTHVISHYTTDISHKTRFINEGTAVCFDLTRQDRLTQVKKWVVANQQQISIKDCWENKAKYAEEILYPLSGLFVKDLIDYFGREKFIEFFENQSYENAQRIFGDKLNKVIKDFENKINT